MFNFKKQQTLKTLSMRKKAAKQSPIQLRIFGVRVQTLVRSKKIANLDANVLVHVKK